MPIRPERKHLYPANWKSEIVPAVRKRSGDCCEACRVINGELIQRNLEGSLWRYVVAPAICFHISPGGRHFLSSSFPENLWRPPIKIVLTVAHLNHDEADCRIDNLRHWCQLHHNQFDAWHRANGIKARRAIAPESSA